MSARSESASAARTGSPYPLGLARRRTRFRCALAVSKVRDDSGGILGGFWGDSGGIGILRWRVESARTLPPGGRFPVSAAARINSAQSGVSWTEH